MEDPQDVLYVPVLPVPSAPINLSCLWCSSDCNEMIKLDCNCDVPLHIRCLESWKRERTLCPGCGIVTALPPSPKDYEMLRSDSYIAMSEIDTVEPIENRCSCSNLCVPVTSILFAIGVFAYAFGRNIHNN